MSMNRNQIQRLRSDSGIVSGSRSPNLDGNIDELGETTTNAEEYLCKSPSKNGVINKRSQIFNFSQINSESGDHYNEWIPMLTNQNQIQRPRSDSGTVSKSGLPNVDGNSDKLCETSFSNPT
ncbi:uncharacterized protein LOC143918562 [Arctopsyche grandis]|uniref:uncharacterized protein LOC143918562 n=1 Tax=Arctopsyche grandis TaxID=121162 RepID=UPI00406D7B52